MIKKIITIYTIFSLVVISISLTGAAVAGKPDFTGKTNPSGRIVAIPAHAVEVAPGLFYLGTAVDNGRLVEGYAMFVKPTCDNDGICEPELGENPSCADCKSNGEDPEEPDTSSCYGFLAKGAKWKSVEPYIVDTTNEEGLTQAFISDNLAMDIDKWEGYAGVDILGDEEAGIVDGADLEETDGKNEVYFADIDYEGVIAMAVVWGIFGGPPPFRKLVEWDMVFDDVDFDWSEDAEGSTTEMDFENIATHELGHAVGLDDLYDTKCSDQTMYGYSWEGETKKRTLEEGDIKGIRGLY